MAGVFPDTAHIYWLVQGHLTPNNETVSRQLPWVSGQHCENYGVKRKTVHCYLQDVHHCCTSFVNNVIVFHQLDPFALRYNQPVNVRSLGNSEFCFPQITMFPQDEVEGNTEIQGKQNSLFSLGPDIKS